MVCDAQERGLPRVLVADDDALSQQFIRRVLETDGCQVDVVSNGQDAVRAVAARQYDLVFLDCVMPELDGMQACRAIRRLGGGRGRVPIVAMTGDSVRSPQQDCLAAGMDAYLVKPAPLAAYRDMVRRWTHPGGAGSGPISAV